MSGWLLPVMFAANTALNLFGNYQQSQQSQSRADANAKIAQLAVDNANSARARMKGDLLGIDANAKSQQIQATQTKITGSVARIQQEIGITDSLYDLAQKGASATNQRLGGGLSGTSTAQSASADVYDRIIDRQARAIDLFTTQKKITKLSEKTGDKLIEYNRQLARSDRKLRQVEIERAAQAGQIRANLANQERQYLQTNLWTTQTAGLIGSSIDFAVMDKYMNWGVGDWIGSLWGGSSTPNWYTPEQLARLKNRY